ncbi:MAG: HPr kinase/phosphorylase [Alphaproteobacteria bacterium]
MSGTLRHATCVEAEGCGILLRGPSGSGKSDLALRLIERGALLVADDQVALTAEEGAVWASPPPELAGRMEIRGVGIVSVRHAPRARVFLVCDLVAADAVPRLPEPAREELLPGCFVTRLALHAFEASAPAKLRHASAAAALGAGSVSDS